MLPFGQALGLARAEAGLSVGDVAALTGIAPTLLSSFEDGASAPGKAMDRCALAFGVRLSDFLNGEGARAEVALLFKRVAAIQEPESARLQFISLDRHLGVSTFCRIAWDLAELAELLARPRTALPDLRSAYDSRPRGLGAGDYLATTARRELDISPTEPVASMRTLFGRLNIPVVLSEQGEVDPRVGGASVLLPAPTVLLVPTWNRVWVTRMTLAHELCHLLFHRTGLSVSGESGSDDWRLDEGYDVREQEANAFAAAFLVPRFAVQQLLQGNRPDDAAAIGLVGSHFGVGRQVAVNRLVDTFNLSASRRDAMLALSGHWSAHFESDELLDDELGLRRGPLRALAIDALRKGLISKTRARSMLDIPDEQPIEADELSPEQQAPVLSRTQWLARRCQAQLVERGHPWIVGTLETAADGYSVRLLSLAGDVVAHAKIDAEGTIAEVRLA